MEPNIHNPISERLEENQVHLERVIKKLSKPGLSDSRRSALKFEEGRLRRDISRDMQACTHLDERPVLEPALS